MGNEASKARSPVGRRMSFDPTTEDTVIKLNGQDLDTIPDSTLVILDSVTLLYLNNNHLKELPYSLEKLTTLEINANGFNDKTIKILDVLKSYPVIESLSINNNELTEIPIQALSTPSLRILKIACNLLEKIPDKLGSIQSLDLSQNRFKDFPKLPPTIFGLDISFNDFPETTNIPSTSLIRLNISMCGISNITIGLTNNLREINLSRNPLTSIPLISSFAPNLTALDLSYTNIRVIPPLPNTIETLIMNGCFLAGVPDFISTLPNLKMLNLERNEIETLPPMPKSIESLFLSRNRITTVAKCETPLLVSLDMSRNRLSSLPQFEKHRIVDLDLSKNNIRVITAEFMAHVVNANLSSNLIEKIPSKVFKQHLRSFNVAGNKLTVLKKAVRQSNITHLNISYNNFETLPKLPRSIVEFFASKCGLKTLPEHFSHLPKLSRIVMAFNQLETIECPPEARVWCLTGNKLKMFPPFCSSVKFVDLSMNKIRSLDNISYDSIELLDLSRNRIKTIPPSFRVPACRVLKLALNPVTWAFDSMRFPSLTDIDAAATQITFPEEPDIETFRVSLKPQRTVKCLHMSSVSWAGYSETFGINSNMENNLSIRVNIEPNISAFALFEGHGGGKLSRYISKRFVSDLKANSKMLSKTALNSVMRMMCEDCLGHTFNDGSSALAIVLGEGEFICSNLGSSRAMIVTTRREVRWQSRLRRPDTPDELKRIHAAGGAVSSNGRVQGVLRSGRSIGDFHVRGISTEPDTTRVHITPDDRYLIIGSSTLYASITPEFIAQLCDGRPARDIAYEVKNSAFVFGERNNVSVIVIDLLARKGEVHRPAVIRVPGAPDLPQPTQARRMSLDELIWEEDEDINY